MKYVLYLSAVVLIAVCATWAYRVNYATQEARNRVGALRLAIAREHEAIGVLNAEWAYLNRPDRLRALVDANARTLDLAPLTPDQFADVAMVAMPPDPSAPPPEDTAGTHPGTARPPAGHGPAPRAQAAHAPASAGVVE